LRKLMILVAVLALMLVLAAPAFAQTGFFGFNDIQGVTYGGNCVVNDVAEICTVPLGF
jgi:hypothetical protein